MLMAVCHTDKEGWTKVEDLATLSDLRGNSDAVLWAESDISGLTQEDIDTISEEFGLHELAVEDAMNTRQRPKLERYPTHLFVVFHQLDDEDGQFEARQIACFIGDRFVLTLHEGAARSLDQAKERLERYEDPIENPALLVYTLLDTVVDDYQAKADALESEIETLEEIVLETPRAPVQRQLYSLKQQVTKLQHYVLPGERILDWVDAPAGQQPFSGKTIALFRDIHDHLVRMREQVRSVDDLSQAVLDLTRAEQADALSEVSKKLSAWAAIFAIETLIAGIYGMNFQLIPNENSIEGFYFAIALMVIAGVGVYAYFKRRDWI